MIAPGQRVELVVEKPAAGGRMIARHEGQVVLVSGAIPGERVTALVERVERRLAFAAVARVLEASADRREWTSDAACGGCSYGHIRYARQRALKAETIADAFARIAKMPLPAAPDVAGSPEHGYRMRARLHVRRGRAGFYREGTHELCDAGATGQLHPDAVPAIQQLVGRLEAAGTPAVSIEMADTRAGDARAAHVELSGALPDPAGVAALPGPRLTSVTLMGADGRRVGAGPGRIGEPLADLTGGRAAGTLHRTAESFFQANRFLLPELVTAAMDAVLPEGPVLDLYAGVGLFALALGGSGRVGIVAVEGAGASGADLRLNAAATNGAVVPVTSSVERFLARRTVLPPTVIVDPPRTGLSREALQALAGSPPRRLVYVSCDPPTLARDARRLVDGGMVLQSLRGFDLFPNTPHVEVLAIFDRP